MRNVSHKLITQKLINRSIMRRIYILSIAVCLLFSCNNGIQISKSINGFAQKGPFISGSQVTISELDDSLKPTGRIFFSTIQNEFGYFEFPNIEFSSNYVELMAEGYYFYEAGALGGWTTQSQLVLKSIVDLTNSNSININILTHIERERVIYLTQNSGLELNEAKKQARNELLQVFTFETNQTANFEDFDLSSRNKHNDILIAISSIIQSYYDVPKLTSLLNQFIQDFRDNGEIDNTQLQEGLVLAAKFLNTGGIRKNLSEFYKDTIFSTFQFYVEDFLDNTSYPSQYKNVFPTFSTEGRNLLNLSDNSRVFPDSSYYAGVDFSNITTEFRIVLQIKMVSGSGSFSVSENDLTGLDIPDFNNETLHLGDHEIQIGFIKPQKSIPFTFTFEGHGELEIQFQAWFENFPELKYCSKYLKW